MKSARDQTTQRLNAEQLQFLRRQHGVATAAQLHALGVSDADRRALYRRGDLVIARRDVFVLRALPATFKQTVKAAVLSVGDPVAACGVTAARLWQLPNTPRFDCIQLTVPHHRRSMQEGLNVTRQRRFPERAIVSLETIPITNPAHTIGRLARILGQSWVASAVDFCLRERLVTLEKFRDGVEYLSAINRADSRALHRVVSLRDESFSRVESVLEARALSAIRASKLPPPVAQHVVRVGGKSRRVDFAYPDLKLAIEIDGFKFHSDRGVFERDRELSNRLQALGWIVFRFTSLTPDDELVAAIRDAISLRLGGSGVNTDV